MLTAEVVARRWATLATLGLGVLAAVSSGAVVGVAPNPEQMLALLVTAVVGLALLGHVEASGGLLLVVAASTQGLLASVGGLSTLVYAGVGLLALLSSRTPVASRSMPDHAARAVCVGSAVLLGALALATTVSVDVLQSMRSLVRFSAPLAVYVLIRRIASSPEGSARLQTAVGFSAVVPVLVGLVQILSGGQTAELLERDEADAVTGVYSWSRFQGTFQHPNAFAAYLAVVLPLLVVLWRGEPRRGWRTFWMALAGVAAGELLWGRVRSSWGAVLIGALVVLALLRRKGPLIGLLLCTGLLAQTSWVRARVAPLFATPLATLLQENALEVGARSSLQGRIWLWIGAWSLVSQRPWLGWGPGSWYSQLAAAQLQGFSLHSDYLHVMVEAGFVGLAGFLVLRGALVWSALSVLGRARAGSRAHALAAASLMSVVVVCIVGTTESVFFGYSMVEWYVWATLALAHGELARQPAPAT